MGNGADDRSTVGDHEIERDGARRRPAVQDICGGIADEDGIDASLVEDLGHCEIVGCEHGDLVSVLLHLPKSIYCDLRCLLGHFFVMGIYCAKIGKILKGWMLWALVEDIGIRP